MTTDKTPEKIKNMFDEISSYYDQMNNYISLGSHMVIKYLALKALDLRPRTMLLDLCCGSGDFTKLISKFFPRVKVIGLDFSEKMLKIAKEKNPIGVFMQGDCTNLPFNDGEFDYVTISFGLRNIQDRQKAVSEIYRVLAKDGKFLHLDFGEHNLISKIFDFIVIMLAKILKKDWKAYEYLLQSKEEFPSPDKLIQEFEHCGFKYVKKCNYLFGVVSVQIMQK